MKSVCIIPARGGSKRIPRKNIKDFCGKPIIAWVIETVRKSNCVDKIIVSTDDTEIAEVSIQRGAEVPFWRPSELSDDHTPTRPVINHAIREIDVHYGRYDYICCVYPTAVFLKHEDLQKGKELLIETKADFVFSVTSFPYPIKRALRITKTNRVEMFFPEYRYTRSQDLEETYHDAGQFYWGHTNAFLENKPTFSNGSVPFVLPRYRVHDLDTLEDWERAKLMYTALKEF